MTREASCESSTFQLLLQQGSERHSSSLISSCSCFERCRSRASLTADPILYTARELPRNFLSVRSIVRSSPRRRPCLHRTFLASPIYLADFDSPPLASPSRRSQKSLEATARRPASERSDPIGLDLVLFPPTRNPHVFPKSSHSLSSDSTRPAKTVAQGRSSNPSRLAKPPRLASPRVSSYRRVEFEKAISRLRRESHVRGFPSTDTRTRGPVHEPRFDRRPPCIVCFEGDRKDSRVLAPRDQPRRCCCRCGWQ